MKDFAILYALVTAIGLALFFFFRKLADVDGITAAQAQASDDRAAEAIEQAESVLHRCEPRYRRQALQLLAQAKKCKAFNQSGWRPLATAHSTQRKRIRAIAYSKLAQVLCTSKTIP